MTLESGLSVAIYDRGGSSVRWRGSGQTLSKLSFSSSLPGGFEQCVVTVTGTARGIGVEAGQALAVLRGKRVAWWGWVEDIQLDQSGSREQTTILALGPWQQLRQRLASGVFVDVTTTYIVRDMLAAYGPDISQDYSKLTNSSRPLTRTWSNTLVADIVADVCATGDASNTPLLFALWEPPGARQRLGTTGNLTDDPELEQLETYWSKNSDLMYYSSSLFVSPRYSWKWSEGATGGITHKRRISVTASTTYVIDFWLYWTAWAGMTTEARFDWYNSSGDYISSTYTTTLTSDGVSTGWRRIMQTITSPANAAQCVPGIGCYIGTGGGAARYLHVDDVRMYLQTTNLGADRKPRACLWQRDLSDYDYTLRTAATGVSGTTTTRDLANAVLAQYGQQTTTWAEDAASQVDYRRRDYKLDAGAVAQVDAEAARDVYLSRHKLPGVEMGQFVVRGLGAVRDKAGLAVDPALLRAGDRIRIADGRLAGSVIMLSEVSWEDGAARCRPESYEDVTRVLARVD